MLSVDFQHRGNMSIMLTRMGHDAMKCTCRSMEYLCTPAFTLPTISFFSSRAKATWVRAAAMNATGTAKKEAAAAGARAWSVEMDKPAPCSMHASCYPA